MQEIYISFDVEADGPSPAINNCLQIAFVAFKKIANPQADKLNEWVVDTLDLCFIPQLNKWPDKETMETFWSRFPNVLQRIRDNAKPPFNQIQRLSDWLFNLEKKYIIKKWVAKPAAYDWQWLNCMYYSNYMDGMGMYRLPFKAECLSSMMSAVKMMDPKFELPKNDLPHTHYAIDDAIEQAFMYIKLVYCLENKGLAVL